MAEKLPVIIGNWGDSAALRTLQEIVTTPFVEVCQT